MAERVGFELAVRAAKFAFDFSAEFTASVAKFGFGENFAPEVLKQTIHLVSAVRSQSKEAPIEAGAMYLLACLLVTQADMLCPPDF